MNVRDFTIGVLTGLLIVWSVWKLQDKPKTPEALPCPNGAVGQVLHADGTTYCSYLMGTYRAQVKWKEI